MENNFLLLFRSTAKRKIIRKLKVAHDYYNRGMNGNAI